MTMSDNEWKRMILVKANPEIVVSKNLKKLYTNFTG